MQDGTITSQKIQQQMRKYVEIMEKYFGKPKHKFISQMIYGIQASRDVKLSNIARSLNEDIKLIKTENRLSRQVTARDMTHMINTILLEKSCQCIGVDTVLALDLSDVHKPFAKKMEYLAKVWDGSEGKIKPGYWLCEVIGVKVNDENPIPLYSELYSQKADGFDSENEQILLAVKVVSAFTRGRGIWAMDRGADREILLGEMSARGLRFVVRGRGARIMKDETGKEWRMTELLKGVRYKDHYTVAVDREGYTEQIEVRLGVKHDLYIDATKVSMVVVKGFGKEPMLLLTNVDKSPREILEIYLTRWKCEEAFRFLKHEYHLEDVRVRRYTGLRNTVALLHAVFYFLCMHLGRRLKLQILLNKILDKAKRFFEIPPFKHYAVADGIYRLLYNRGWAPENRREPEDFFNKNQLCLDLT